MPTLCLVMIVKNEAHIITDTLRHLLKYIPINTWSICDTGSTDSTKEDIVRFFAEHGIPGKIHDTEWKDFGHNRSVAFEMAADSADYSFVWDADDSIQGDFVFPKNLHADWYKFMFGNSGGFRYSRCQLFSNRKRWKYLGVLHEYPACMEACDSPVEVGGNYYFVSGRSGARNKNPMKYRDDALILEEAYRIAVEKKDPIHCRYAFYCAQSYASAAMSEKAVEFYRVVLTLNNWAQEKYMSCLSIYTHLNILGKEQEGLSYLVEAFKYDRTRVECVYRLVKYYCIQGLPEVALAYYGLIQTYFERQYISETGGRERLFANMDEYDFYLPYYMIIVGDRMKRHDIAAQMYEIIFRKRFTGTTKWWIDNLFINIQFCFHAFPKTVEFLGIMFDYVNELRSAKLYLNQKHNEILTKIVESYTPVLCAAVPTTSLPAPARSPSPRVMLTMTTCKRLNLFRRTVNSILNTWTDVAQIDAFFCVDDNSSEEDRQAMRSEFPFFEYYMKSPSERGHRESMNIIWEKLCKETPTYWIHLEDDWMFFHRESYVERGILALEKYSTQNIQQIVFNRNYGVVYNDLERTGGFEQSDRIILHELNPNLPGRHSGYWPHYSLQPSICRAKTIIELGDYVTPHRFFERGYAEKYNAAGYKTGFFDSVYSTHIGKQHWESEGQNAYSLNEVSQFQLTTPTNEPLVGTMEQHLDQIIAKIRARRPFGLIRPSDGEYTILKNRTLTNCDAWTWVSGGILREQLAQSISMVDPNLYIGIPCNSCNKPWNCTEEIYRDFTEKFRVPVGQTTYANIFMNSNWNKWKDFMQNYSGPLYFVGSGTEESTLPLRGRHVISATLVNSWDTERESETERLYTFIHNIQNALVCFAAGPLSKVWIPLCMKRNPTNMYIDVGASLDTYTKGGTNRMYTNPSHSFAKETCVFRKKPRRSLVYFSVFLNEGYIDLLKLLLTSLIYFSKIDGIDFLVLTSENFREKIEALARELDLTLQFHFMECTSVHEASSSKLCIFDYPSIDSYETILYLDTDIIIQGDITKIINDNHDDIIYALAEGKIAHEFWGGTLFDRNTVNLDASGFNAGVLLFKNSVTSRAIFKAAREHIDKMKREGVKLPHCLEQPFLNFHAYSKSNTSYFQKYATLNADKLSALPSSPTDISICHFAWPIGEAVHKMKRMKSHLRHLCSNYSKLYGTNTEVLPAYNKYKWGNGFIEITESGLNTMWGAGEYKILNAQMLYLVWKGLTHLVRFNSSMNRYISVRIKDTTIVTGERIYDPTKNLLYFCVFHNRDYCKLARLLLTSMRLYSPVKGFDILIITTEEFREDLEQVAKDLQLNILVYTLPLKTVFEAACARLKIFDWEEIGLYKTILYLDTDILVKGDLTPLFQILTEDKLYAIQSGTIASSNFGRELFQGWVDFSRTGFNSGTLLFSNSTKIREMFKNTWAHAMKYSAAPPSCMDQPFLNYHAIKDNLYNNTLLNPFVSLYEDNDIVTNETTSVLCHFSFPIGNFAHKFQRMSTYFRERLSRKEHVHNALIGKTYSWGSGFISFMPFGLETKWGGGTYEVLGENRVKASWRQFDHYLTFSNSAAEFISVRTEPDDFNVIIGKLQKPVVTHHVTTSPADYPLILHTCDKYQQFWNHWYFFFRKYVSGVSKVYFLTEEKSPVFSSEVTVIKTGKGPWGKRLITAMGQIPEPYVYYMQEDFWASQPFRPNDYVSVFFEYEMDALRISAKSPLYSLTPVKPPLYRFQQKSDYLMTHQFSLWKRSYFLQWIRENDEPWANEMEQSVEIAKTDHSIYLIDASWYEATVRRGILQENGEQLLQRHSEEIAMSFIENDWYSKFLLKIREHLAREPVETFPKWKILDFTMFTAANAAECAVIGYTGDPPIDRLQGNKMHQQFLWAKFIEIVGQTEIQGIFEFGGGYGQLRNVVYEKCADIPYAIYDFPELHAIQRYFLGEIPTEFFAAKEKLPTSKYNVFISFWAYSECPKEVRDEMIPFFKAAAFDVLFFGIAQRFQMDNILYLSELADILGYSVEFVPIEEMKSHDGQQFFVTLRKGIVFKN